MSNTPPKSWRETTTFRAELKDENGSIAIAVILRYQGDSPNPTRRASLEFVGPCEDADGTVVLRRKNYLLTEKTAAAIVEAMQSLAAYEQTRRRPEIARQYFRAMTDEFVISLKQLPDKTVFVLRNERDKWSFETADRDALFDAFCSAAR